MARYNPYNRGMQYPDMQENTQVPYLSYYDPQQVERLGTVIQQRGQRYDAAQAAIAKYLEDAGATEMRGPDRDAVISKISSELENVKGKVKERYNGDYGLAVNDVIQGLSKSSGIYKQAGQKYKEEQKYLPLYQKLKSEGKLVTPKGALNPFEQSSFDESTGRFKDIDYSQMYERNDYNKWIKENISDRLSQNISDDLTGVIKTAKSGQDAFLIMQKVKGMRQDQIGSQISDEDIEMFIKQNPTYKLEFSDGKGGIDMNAAKQFVTETAKNQVIYQIDKQLVNNPYWRDKNTTSNDSLFSLPGIAGVVPEENLLQAKQEVSGLKGRSMLGNYLVSNAKRMAEWNSPDRWTQLGYGLVSSFSVDPASRLFNSGMRNLYKSKVSEQTENFNKTIEQASEILNKKVQDGTASPREKKYSTWLKDDTNQDTPLGQAVLKHYNLESTSNDKFREKMQDYVKDFSTMSINPRIEIQYNRDKNGNLDLKDMEERDKLFFNPSKDGFPTLTGEVVNTKLFDIETGEMITGTEFAKEHAEDPVQGYAKYSSDNPYAPGARQVIVGTKDGPKVYAMVPFDQEVAKETLPWQFNQARYLPEQELELDIPNIYGKEDKVKLINTATGKEGKNKPVYEMYINGDKIVLQNDAKITNQAGMSAGDIAYRLYLKYLSQQNKD